ncbi:histone acetyltransferase 1 [Homalodisca vitripennis]|nr:histone acetyltransferase 1 [Homalodisca vitripennis]
MSHQIFGDNESIFGYKGLRVKLYYSACRLTMYLGQEYQTVVDPDTFDGVEPDNVLQLIQEKLQIPHVIKNIDEFVNALKDDESFQPFGDKMTSFTVEEDYGSKTYDIYHCDTSNQKFLNFHERLQTFILFYIDAASYIDVDDSKWQFFVLTSVNRASLNRDSGLTEAVLGRFFLFKKQKKHAQTTYSNERLGAPFIAIRTLACNALALIFAECIRHCHPTPLARAAAGVVTRHRSPPDQCELFQCRDATEPLALPTTPIRLRSLVRI